MELKVNNYRKSVYTKGDDAQGIISALMTAEILYQSLKDEHDNVEKKIDIHQFEETKFIEGKLPKSDKYHLLLQDDNYIGCPVDVIEATVDLERSHMLKFISKMLTIGLDKFTCYDTQEIRLFHVTKDFFVVAAYQKESIVLVKMDIVSFLNYHMYDKVEIGGYDKYGSLYDHLVLMAVDRDNRKIVEGMDTTYEMYELSKIKEHMVRGSFVYRGGAHV